MRINGRPAWSATPAQRQEAALQAEADRKKIQASRPKPTK